MHTQPATVPSPALETLLLDGALNLLAAIVILILGWMIAAWAARLTERGLGRLPHFDETLKPLLVSLVRYAVLAAAIIAVLQRFGIETTSLIAVLGAAGLAVGLAIQGTLSNVAAGIMLLLLRPYRVGEYVQAAGRSGTVRQVGLFTTILIADDLSYVSIPNSSIFSAVIVNYSREPTSRINVTVSVDFVNDIDAAQKIILDVLNADRRVLKTPPPATGVAALHEYSIDLVVRCWVRNADSEVVLFSVQEEIKKRFHESGIAIPARRQIATAREEPASASHKVH